MRTACGALVLSLVFAWRPAVGAAQTTLDSPGAVASVPGIATTPAGTIVVVWQSATPGSPDDVVLTRSRNAQDWTMPSALAPAEPSAPRRLDPAVAGSTAGTWAAAWAEECATGLPGPVAVSRSGDDAATWSQAVAVSAGGCAAPPGPFRAARPAVTTDGAGRWIVAWQDVVVPYGAEQVVAVRSGDDARTWTAPAVLDAAAPGEVGVAGIAVAVATDAAGTWGAAWIRASAGAADVVVARSVDAGLAWTAPVVLQAAPSVDAAPALATDAAGRWGVVWRTGDDAFAWASSVDGGVTWSAPRTIVTDGGRISDLRPPAMAADASGRWAITWSAAGALGGALGSDLDVLYAASLDGGATWTAPRPLDRRAARDDGRSDVTPALAADAAGFLVVWDSFTTDVDGFPATDVRFTPLR